jgi:hypothetical protein
MDFSYYSLIKIVKQKEAVEWDRKHLIGQEDISEQRRTNLCKSV